MCPCLAGVHAQNQEFYSGGGGGGGGPTAGKQSGQRFFFFALFFYSPKLILQLAEGSNCFITEKTILF